MEAHGLFLVFQRLGGKCTVDSVHNLGRAARERAFGDGSAAVNFGLGLHVSVRREAACARATTDAGVTNNPPVPRRLT